MSIQTLFDLTGKVALVTGGNGGIGLGMARGLAGAGANIVVAARNAEKTGQAVAELESLGVQAIGLTVDRNPGTGHKGDGGRLHIRLRPGGHPGQQCRDSRA